MKKDLMRAIKFNGLDEFIKHSKKQYPKEACAFLFSDKPYHPEEEWHILIVDNVSQTPEEAWIPNKQQMQKAKNQAKKNGWTKIGNLHSHPFHDDKDSGDIPLNLIKDIARPSPKDLSFAQKHNDIIRGILVCDSNQTYALLFHDKYGKQTEYYKRTNLRK